MSVRRKGKERGRTWERPLSIEVRGEAAVVRRVGRDEAIELLDGVQVGLELDAAVAERPPARATSQFSSVAATTATRERERERTHVGRMANQPRAASYRWARRLCSAALSSEVAWMRARPNEMRRKRSSRESG